MRSFISGGATPNTHIASVTDYYLGSGDKCGPQTITGGGGRGRPWLRQGELEYVGVGQWVQEGQRAPIKRGPRVLHAVMTRGCQHLSKTYYMGTYYFKAGVQEERGPCITRGRREEEGGTWGSSAASSKPPASARGAGHMAAAPSQDRELSAVAL